MMRYRLYVSTGYEDKLIYEDDDFLKVAHKMISCNGHYEYSLQYRSEMINEIEYLYYPENQMVVELGYSGSKTMHMDTFIAYLETLDGGEG